MDSKLNSFVEQHNDLEPIESKVVSVKPKEEDACNIFGLFVISEQRLKELDESQFLKAKGLVIRVLSSNLRVASN